MEIGATTSELLQAQAHVFHHVLAYCGSMALKCAIQLGIPDAIHAQGRPLTISELASSLPVAPTKSPSLHRLMRVLAHMGYFSVRKGPDGSGEEDAYSLTPNTRVLLKDSPTSLASWVVGMLQMSIGRSPFHFLSAFYQADQSTNPIAIGEGKPLYELTADDAAFNHLFNETMAGDSRLVIKAVVTDCKDAFQGLKSLVDVGGGNGTVARTIVQAFPHIKCTVYDLPHVIATVPEGSFVEAVGGNMFEYIPPADALIMHNWSDEQCVKILKLCKEAIPTREDGGKVMIVDIVLNDSNGDASMTETQLFWDIAMLTWTEGKEREEYEWRRIFLDAGFTDYKITPILGARSLIEVFP